MNRHRIHSTRLLAMGLLMSGLGIARGDEIPRYQLQVGQQYVFHSERIEKHGGAQPTSGDHYTDWTVDVLARNADGSWHVVGLVDSGGTFHQGTTSVPYERIVEAADCDLYPDGTLMGADDPLLNLPRLFPRLPADAKQLENGWDDQTADHRRNLHFQATGGDAQGSIFAFTSIPVGGVQGVFEPGSRQDYRFNRTVGAVDDMQFSTGSADPAYSEKGEIRRTAINRLDAATIAKIAGLASEYDQAQAGYRKALASDGQNGSLNTAQAQLQQTANALLVGLISDLAKAQIHDNSAMSPDPPSPKDILNQPAPDWTLKDLDGNSHSLKDFRGKVVLLDFGSRACPWCIREIPQLIRLSQDFKDQPVAIIDMDLDTDVADAKFVMDKMQMPYLMLLASDAAKGYAVEGTPMVVVVDQSGMMRRRFVGYDNTGYDQMKAAIQSLLNANQGVTESK